MRLRMIFWIKLAIRAAITIFLSVIYFIHRDWLDFTKEPVWVGMYILFGVFFIELLSRFIPGAFHPTGMQKNLKSQFVPTPHYLKDGITEADRRLIRKLNKQAAITFVVFFILNSIWFVLYFLHIIGVPELVMIMTLYCFGDMICANGFCPYRIFLMKNRCCNVCRIYRWDSVMAVTPLMVILHPLSMSLVAVGVITFLVWEVSFYRHPERFLETCNASLQCKNCKQAICPRKRKESLLFYFKVR